MASAERGARTEGVAALEPIALAAVRAGADRILDLVVARGFRFADARRPERLCGEWTGLGGPCKPTTGSILLRQRLPLTYPCDREYSTWPLHGVAVGCRDVASARVMIEGGAPVNAIDENGETALDLARR